LLDIIYSAIIYWENRINSINGVYQWWCSNSNRSRFQTWGFGQNQNKMCYTFYVWTATRYPL